MGVAIRIAFLILSIQIGMGIISTSGLFSGSYYENTITGFKSGEDISVINEREQDLAGINLINNLEKLLAWGWIKEFFQPLYSIDQEVRKFVDNIITFMNVITTFIISIAFIEFFRNRADLLR